MTLASRTEGDLYVTGNINSGTLTVPAGTITNSMVVANAGIDATKLMHGIHKNYSEDIATEASAFSKCIHIARTTGTVMAFEVSYEAVAVTDKACAIDLQKSTAGGAFGTILTGTIALNASTTVRVVYAGTLTAGASLIDGDILRIVVTLSGSTGNYPKGITCEVVIHENYIA